MGLKEIAKGMLSKAFNKEDRPDIPDDQTTDKFLRSLRRQRRLQIEELEKARLKKSISDFQRNKTREHLYGFKSRNPVKRNLYKKKKINQVPIRTKKAGFLGKIRLRNRGAI